MGERVNEGVEVDEDGGVERALGDFAHGVSQTCLLS